MSSSDYNRYLKAIEAANDAKSTEALKKIKIALYENFDPMDEDIDRLIKKFRYHV